MKVFIWLIILFPLWLQAEEDLKIRAQFITSEESSSASGETFEAVVGGRVTLAVDVLTNRWFTKAPRFSHLTVRDAINLKAETFATNFSERVGAENYAVQRREYTIFPQRPGQFVIDGVEVIVWAAGEPGKPLKKRTLRSKPLLMMVNALPPVEGDELQKSETLDSGKSPSLVASDVVISQSFSSDLDSLSVGDLVERKIEVRAVGTLGMLIPPLAWPEVKGIKQASLSSSVDDKTNRGEFEGVRLETRQYTLLADGSAELPAISLWWWDGDVWQKSQVAAQSLTNIQPRKGSRSRDLPLSLNVESLDKNSILKLVSWACVVLLVGVACWRLLRVVGAGAVKIIAEVYGSEQWLLASLRFAVCFQSAASVVMAYYRWRNASVEPLKPVPELSDSLWSQWCQMAQERTQPRFSQRGELLSMIRVMRGEAVVSTHGRDVISVSGVRPLQPLNPE